MANIFDSSGINNPYFSNGVGDIDTIERNIEKLNQLKNSNKVAPQVKGRFAMLEDFAKSLPEGKAQWAAQQTAVKEKTNTMLAIFTTNYLFEQCKVQFEDWCKQNGVAIVDEYVDTFIDTARNYVDPISTQSQEIAELKKIIQDMQSKKVGDML